MMNLLPEIHLLNFLICPVQWSFDTIRVTTIYMKYFCEGSSESPNCRLIPSNKLNCVFLNVAIPATSRYTCSYIMLSHAIPVSADPSIAGNADGNLASGIVPELRFDAFKADPSIKPAPFVS